MRVTKDNIRASAESLASILARWEVIPADHEVMITGGSATYGVSWRVVWRPVGEKRWNDLPCIDLAGCYTLKEVYAKITTTIYALSQLRYELSYRTI